MKKKREIVTFTIAALATLSAVWLLFGNMKEKRIAWQTDLYTLIAPASDAILAVNRPAAFSKFILSSQPTYEAFASKIPAIYLSIIRQNQELPLLLLSFHPQGIVLYAKASNSQADKIEGTIKAAFASFAPQKQTRGNITFTYYPDTGGRFFGYYRQNGIWIASYSKKLLEEVAEVQTKGLNYLLPEQDRLRRTFDRNAPLNLMIQTDSLNLYVATTDTTAWRIKNSWLAADLFTNEGNLCYFGSLPYKASADTLYAALGDTLALRLNQAFPQLHITSQMNRENGKVYYTGCDK